VEAHFALEDGILSAQSVGDMPLKSEPAVVPGILMSDVSIVEAGTSKRSIVGSFDQFSFKQFPAAYGRFFVTTWIGNMVGTLTEMELTCKIEQKGSAHCIFSNSQHVNFPTEQTFDGKAILATSIAVQGVVFEQPGTYTIVILLNGDKVGERDFNVVLARPKPQPES
jgi:hypothetical protein